MFKVISGWILSSGIPSYPNPRWNLPEGGQVCWLICPPQNMLFFHQFDEVSQVLFRKAHHPSDCPQVPKWSAQHCHVTNDLDAKPKVVFKLCVLGKQFCYSVCKQVDTHSPVCNWGISRLSFQMKNCTPIVVLRKAGDAPGHKPIVVLARQNTSSRPVFGVRARYLKIWYEQRN